MSHCVGSSRLNNDNSANEKTKLKEDFGKDTEDANRPIEEISEEVVELSVGDAIDNARCGLGTILYCIGPSLFFCFEGAEVIVLSIVGLMVQCEWDLSPIWVSALQMNVLFSAALTTFLSSTWGDKFGRRPICLISTIGVTVSGLLCGFVGSYWELFVLRTILGLCLGVGMPPAIALNAEMAPVTFRALSLSSSFTIFGLGGSIASGIAYLVIEPFGWKGLMMVVALVFAPIIICFSVTRESPRYDAKKGKYKRAEKTIKMIYRHNRDNTNFKIKREIPEEGEGEHEEMTYIQIYRIINESGNVKNLVVLCMLGLVSYISYYGIAYGCPRFLNEREGYCMDSEKVVGAQSACVFEKSVLFQLGIVSLSEPLGVLFAVFMVDIAGRRKTFLGGVFLGVLSVTGMYFCISRPLFIANITLTKMCVAISGWTITILSAEYATTEVRSFVVALPICVSKIGSVIGVFCAQHLYNAGPQLFLGLIQACIVATGGCLVLLKKRSPFD